MKLRDLFSRHKDADLKSDDMDEELDTSIVLNDENGNELECEMLDVVECDGREYVALLPVEDTDEFNFIFFRVEGKGAAQPYVYVDNEEEAQRVLEAFKPQVKESLRFMD